MNTPRRRSIVAAQRPGSRVPAAPAPRPLRSGARPASRAAPANAPGAAKVIDDAEHFVRELRRDVAGMIGSFQKVSAKSAEHDARERARCVDDVASWVDGIRESVRATLPRLRAERLRSCGTNLRERQDFLEGVSTWVERVRAEAATLQANFRDASAEVRAAAQDRRRALGAIQTWAQDMRRDAGARAEEVRSERLRIAEDDAAERRRFVEELRRGVRERLAAGASTARGGAPARRAERSASAASGASGASAARTPGGVAQPPRGATPAVKRYAGAHGPSEKSGAVAGKGEAAVVAAVVAPPVAAEQQQPVPPAASAPSASVGASVLEELRQRAEAAKQVVRSLTGAAEGPTVLPEAPSPAPKRARRARNAGA